jgi:diguanylate cyclase (GGDEF)-like protein
MWLRERASSQVVQRLHRAGAKSFVHHPGQSSSGLTPDAPIARLQAVPTLDDAMESVEVDGGLGVLTHAFAEHVAAETALFVVWEKRDELAWPRASWGLRPQTTGVPVRPGEGATGRMLQSDRAGIDRLRPRDRDPIGETTGPARITTVVGAPVRSPAGAAGALCAGFSGRPAESELVVRTAETYAAVAALCFDGSGLLGALTEAARRDELTGCLNYAALQRAIGREISRCERHGRELACCFIDLDGFKRVNDTHGHVAGNRVLAAVASTLRERVRRADLVGRYGGDEFVVVFPETGKGAALNFAQRLRTVIGRATASAIGEPIEASVGVGEWTPGCSADELIDRADKGLRIAKEAGGAVIATPAALEAPRSGARTESRPSRRAKRSPDGPRLLLAIRGLRALRSGRNGR